MHNFIVKKDAIMIAMIKGVSWINKCLRIVISLFLWCPFIQADQTWQSLYQAVSSRVLQAYPLSEQKTVGDIVASGQNSQDNAVDTSQDQEEVDCGGGFNPDAFYTFFTQEIAAPQEFYKKKRSYDILSRIKTVTPSIINQQCWDDLNLLYGNREHPTMF